MVFDAAIHVRAALLAGMALDGGARIDHLQLSGIFRDFNFVTRDNADHRKKGSCRFPAFGTAACMIMRNVTAHPHFHLIVLAATAERTAAEVRIALADSRIDRRMYRHSAHFQSPDYFQQDGRDEGAPGTAPPGVLVVDYGTNGLALMHQIKRLVDLLEWQRVRDERGQLDVPAHGVFHHAGQL